MCLQDSSCFYFSSISATEWRSLFVMLPMLLLGCLYWYGRPQPRRTAYLLATGLPVLTLIVCGVEPATRVAGRVDDGNVQARLVEGNGVRLVWAPDGVGWPRDGVTWHEAVRRCQYLTEDGSTMADVPLNVWRLPMVEEVVRSMSRHGVNSGGVWNEQTKTATYRVWPGQRITALERPLPGYLLVDGD